MNTSASDLDAARAKSVAVTDDWLTCELVDGRSIRVPLQWYPRLSHGSPAEQSNWELIANGRGVRWPDLDEDISIESLLLGERSNESSQSFSRWLRNRTKPSR